MMKGLYVVMMEGTGGGGVGKRYKISGVSGFDALLIFHFDHSVSLVLKTATAEVLRRSLGSCIPYPLYQ